GRDVHMIGTGGAAISDQAYATVAVQPVNAAGRRISDGLVRKPFECALFKDSQGDVGAAARSPARATMTKRRGDRLARDTVADRPAEAAAFGRTVAHRSSVRTGLTSI